MDASGVLHLAYNGFTGTGGGYPVRYGECHSNCNSASSWTFITAADTGGYGGDVRLALDPAGHPRLMFYYGLYGTMESQWRYASCNNNCAASPGNWTLGTAHTLPTSSSHYIASRHNFAIDKLGRPHLIYAGYEASANVTTYLTCAANCSTGEAAWTALVIDPNNQLVASVATTSTGAVRAIFTRGNSSLLSYRECDSGCGTDLSKWSVDQPLFYSAFGEIRIRVDAQDHPRIAWYQGNSGEPAAMATDNKLLYGFCNANCTTPAGWSAATIGLPAQDGKEGFELVLDSTGAPTLAYKQDTPSTLGIAFCVTQCNTATATWSAANMLETTESVAAQVAPPLPTNCTTTQTPRAFWYPGFQASLAVTSTGVAIVHQTKALRSCTNGGSLSDGPALIRVHVLPP